MNFFEFNKQFPTELDCIKYFITIRYNNNPVCRHCGNDNIYHRADYPRIFDCPACHNCFSIFKGTIFEKSDTDLRKWFAEQATAKYEFEMTDSVGQTITKYINLLLTPAFK